MNGGERGKREIDKKRNKRKNWRGKPRKREMAEKKWTGEERNRRMWWKGKEGKKNGERRKREGD